MERIYEGTQVQKIAVIGRKMGDPENGIPGVLDFADHLKREGADLEVASFKPWDAARADFAEKIEKKKDLTGGNGWLDPEEIRSTLMYRENRAWIDELKAKGYHFFDIGNPARDLTHSEFYFMETERLFGKGGARGY